MRTIRLYFSAFIFLAAATILLFAGFSHVGATGAADLPENSRTEIVTVATDATWPPMEFIDATGSLTGFDIDLFTAVGKYAGFTPEFVNVPWDGIFAGIGSRYDSIASSVTILPEREERMIFSIPYFIAAQYLLVRADDRSVRSIQDLRGREVGAEISTTGAWFIESEPGVILRSYDDLGLALHDLIQGRLSGVVADTAIIEYYVFGHPRYADELRIVGEPYAIESYGFVFAPGRESLRDRVDTALREITADGTYQALVDRWFPHIDLQ